MAYERLTKPNEYGTGFTPRKTATTQGEFLMRYANELNRLGAYEDIGLSPEEIEKKLAELKQAKAERDKAVEE